MSAQNVPGQRDPERRPIADYVVALEWLVERLDLVPDDEEGVWLSMGLRRVLRPPAAVNAVLMETFLD